jgi:PAS domain S-box-containing protein
MNEALDILFVEDVASDAEIIYHEIIKSGFNPSKRIVDSKDDFLSALKTKSPDLIICDYSLPQFDGIKALSIRNEICPSIPFILVTGSVNEEVAVECMKAGADDYILKNNLARLGQAILAVMDKKDMRARRELAENLLKEKEYLMNAFLNTAKDIMFVKDDQLRYIIINDQTAIYFGMEKEKIFGKTDFELVNREFAEVCLSSDRRTLEDNVINTTEEFSNNRVFETTKFPLKLIDNRTGIGSIIRDITERKNFEESLRQKITELEKFNDLTVDRELKMIELKKEVNVLLKEMGKAERYKIVE